MKDEQHEQLNSYYKKEIDHLRAKLRDQSSLLWAVVKICGGEVSVDNLLLHSKINGAYVIEDRSNYTTTIIAGD